MRSQSRILPPLEVLFLQKKEEKAHYRKLSKIYKQINQVKLQKSDYQKNSAAQQLQFSQKKKSSVQGISNSTQKAEVQPTKQESSIDVKKAEGKDLLKKPTRSKSGHLEWWVTKSLTPFEKQKFKTQSIENKRIKERLQKSYSLVQNRADLQSHHVELEKIKERLQRFECSPRNKQRYLLKSEETFSKIAKLEKQKANRLALSRISKQQKSSDQSKKLQKSLDCIRGIQNTKKLFIFQNKSSKSLKHRRLQTLQGSKSVTDQLIGKISQTIQNPESVRQSNPQIECMDKLNSIKVVSTNQKKCTRPYLKKLKK